LYKGKYDAPTGSPPVVQETGAYTGDLKVKYEAMAQELAAASRKLINYVNSVVWEHDEINLTGSVGFPAVLRNMLAERFKIVTTPEFLDLKKAIEKA
jgi:hypothetical protein